MTAIPETAVRVPPRVPPHARRRARSHGRFRRLLLGAAVVALPLQDHIPAIGGFSIMYLAFAGLAVVALVAHGSSLFRASAHFVFIVAYAMLAVTALAEVMHENASLSIWFRMAQMIAGGVIIASYCRSSRDIRAALSAFLLAGLWVGVVIWKGVSTSVLAAGAAGFEEASIVRNAALGGIGLHANWNALAFVLAAAGTIATARAILASAKMRFFYAGAAMFCVFGTFLTFSRSGVAALMLGLGYVFMALLNRKLFWRMVLAAAALVLVIALAVPDIVFQRFSVKLEYGPQGVTDSRLHIYAVLLEALPEFGLFGVGAANYWERFAFAKGLFIDTDATGAHNTFLQVWVYWGIAGLGAWAMLTYGAYRALRKGSAKDLEWVSLKGFCLVMLVWAFTSHDVSDKTFSIVLGLIAGLHELRRRGLLPAPGRRFHQL